LLIYSPVSVRAKKDFIPQERRLCVLVLPSAYEGTDPRRAGNAHRAGGDTANSVFIKGALFSAETENIAQSLIIYKSTNTIPQSK
jgi:hypothetical protein